MDMLRSYGLNLVPFDWLGLTLFPAWPTSTRKLAPRPALLANRSSGKQVVASSGNEFDTFFERGTIDVERGVDHGVEGEFTRLLPRGRRHFLP